MISGGGFVCEICKTGAHSGICKSKEQIEMQNYTRGNTKGIAEGLRMAAEICRFEYFRWLETGLETGNTISNHGIFELLRAKAKEVEEGK